MNKLTIFGSELDLISSRLRTVQENSKYKLTIWKITERFQDAKASTKQRSSYCVCFSSLPMLHLDFPSLHSTLLLLSLVSTLSNNPHLLIKILVQPMKNAITPRSLDSLCGRSPPHAKLAKQARMSPTYPNPNTQSYHIKLSLAS
jgi:hypothetical protein